MSGPSFAPQIQFGSSSQSSHVITYIVIENTNCGIPGRDNCADPTEFKRMLAGRLTATRHGASNAQPIPAVGSEIADCEELVETWCGMPLPRSR